MANITPHSLEQLEKFTSPRSNETAQLNPASLSLPEKFINLLMVDGKKNIATQIFCSAAQEFLHSALENPSVSLPKARPVQPLLLLCLRMAVKNVQPLLECRKCRVAGTSHQVPAIVSEKRGESLAVRWIIESARKRRKNSGLKFSQCLAQEFLDAYGKQGRPRQRRDQSHKLASGNRGYLRYRWW